MNSILYVDGAHLLDANAYGPVVMHYWTNDMAREVERTHLNAMEPYRAKRA